MGKQYNFQATFVHYLLQNRTLMGNPFDNEAKKCDLRALDINITIVYNSAIIYG